ncbi:hypothetical protein NS115_03615 [Paenibacillus jamilae]|uniref:Uncharacterized protein n=1 Tax=Paenibacillus jamilae TaxID=114136 RepID=A0ACC4ZZN0_9BACL|nr:hypothetical protein [Paenibacillus jamilae]KTS84432.1 hypothetical protein NS115_03615 [Paenibacillus jamilae]
METEQQKRDSLLGWLDRRLEWPDMTIPISVRAFRSMWLKEFGTEANIPEWIKQKATQKYQAYIEREAALCHPET